MYCIITGGERCVGRSIGEHQLTTGLGQIMPVCVLLVHHIHVNAHSPVFAGGGRGGSVDAFAQESRRVDRVAKWRCNNTCGYNETISRLPDLANKFFFNIK